MPTWVEPLKANIPRRILPANPKRICYTIRNDSSVDVYIGKDSRVSTSGFFRGFKVDAGGGTLEDEFHKGEVWAIAESDCEITVNEDVPVDPPSPQAEEK